MRLVEPLGLLVGEAAERAIETGLALPLVGGPKAFCLCRLLGDGAPDRIHRVEGVPASWHEELHRLTRPIPSWADLPGDRPAVMGVLNVTPDSFSDGGEHADPVAAGLAMARAGADIIDVGGESTRPGALAVGPEVEQDRILPVIRGLAARGVRISVDTRNAATMAAALDAGAAIVNDISALTRDPAASRLIAARGCPVVLMHMRGEPATMNSAAQYSDVAVEVVEALAERVAAATRAGVDPARIAIDPGFGFAKTGRHNAELLTRLGLLLNLGRRILVGVSRKSFIGTLSGVASARDRDAGSLAAGLYALARGASILRVHDVARTTQAARVWAGVPR